MEAEQDAQIDDRAESVNGGSAQSTGKMDPQEPGWTNRVRVGKHPPDRTPCLDRVGALEQTSLHGFGMRYRKSRLNAEKTKCMQETNAGQWRLQLRTLCRRQLIDGANGTCWRKQRRP
ncbi:uncharacterized protein [Aegilops tauschii subsp. strangulata]|uniref:uncharacterized protein isoform X3 n=1 Tax=Triticum aestivum TaxID=4565 RepID=UPI001D023249|nr:uncharacterized protein LOC123166317 isoform X3 [Triticum aestivum]XP_045086704.1 uncharacterized protein LOC109780277 isoform X3 [Aegilops tauschii subsp. strangulata]